MSENPHGHNPREPHDAAGAAADDERLDDLTLDNEERVTGSAQMRRGVILLPNILTAGTLISGFYSIVLAQQGRFILAAWAIFAAMVFDSMDGRVARWTRTQSRFGAEYDNLSDMVAFGIAPAILMLLWGMGSLAQWAYPVATLYVLCCSLRLARFSTNSDASKDPGHYFQGLPAPAAACFIAAIVWALQTQGLNAGALSVGVLCASFLSVTAVCMVSKFPYLSFKGFDVANRVPLVSFLLIAFGISLLFFLPAIMLMFLGIVFLLSGPFMWVLGVNKPKKAQQPQEGASAAAASVPPAGADDGRQQHAEKDSIN